MAIWHYIRLFKQQKFVLHWDYELDSCGTLHVTGPHNFTMSVTIRSCFFIGVDMSLLEEVCHFGERL